MSDIAEAMRQALAASFISHIYQGDCPDELQPDARDSECGACRLLMALQAAQAAQAEPVAWMDNEGRVLSLEQMKNAREHHGAPGKKLAAAYSTPLFASAPSPGWISVEDRLPELTDDEDVAVYTWDGKTVAEDTYEPCYEQPAGPMVGGWLRVGDEFGDSYRTVTHWMLRVMPAPPAAMAQAEQSGDAA